MKIRIYETDFDGRPVDCSGELREPRFADMCRNGLFS